MARLTDETVTIRAKQGDTLDAICWAHYGTTDPVDAVLAENMGLAAHGPIVPMGTIITLPPLSKISPKTVKEVALW
jgi:phage tail protein X